MIPLGAQADVTVYGRINNGIQFSDPADPEADSTTDLTNYGSRLGFKANSDLGNGLTALGHYEFGIQGDKKFHTRTVKDSEGQESEDSVFQTRHAYVGLSGGFGKLTLGQQAAAFYSNVHFDQSIWNGGHGVYPGSRSSNTIKYSNAVGPVSLQADLRVDSATDGVLESGTEGLGKGNGGAVGLQAALSDNVTLGFGFDSQDQSDAGGPETDWIGISSMVSLGQFWGSLAFANKEETGAKDTESIQFWAGASLTDQTSALFGYGQSEEDEDTKTPNTVTVGMVHNLGGGLRVWYEGNAKDDDVANMDTAVLHEVGLRFDF